MRCIERIAKVAGGGKERVLRSALVIVYESGWGLDLAHALVILHNLPLYNDLDQVLYN
jgi:hypothetical protein